MTWCQEIKTPHGPTVRYGRHTQRDTYPARVARWLIAHRHDPEPARINPTGRGDETEYSVGRIYMRVRTLDMIASADDLIFALRRRTYE